MKTDKTQERTWIIQRFNEKKRQYEDWPGYCENPMTRNEMLIALKKCDEEWLGHEEFRGHNLKR